MNTISYLKVESVPRFACPAAEDSKAGNFRNYHTELMKITQHDRSPAHRWTGGLLGKKKSYELAALKGGGSHRSLAEWDRAEFLKWIETGVKESQNGEEIKLEDKAKQDLTRRCVVLGKQNYGVTGKLHVSELSKKAKKADENGTPVPHQIDWDEGDCFRPVQQQRKKISQILATGGSIADSKVISDTAYGARMRVIDFNEEDEEALKKQKDKIEAGLNEICDKKWTGPLGAWRRESAKRRLVAAMSNTDFRLSVLTARKQHAANEIKSCLAKEVARFWPSDDEGYRNHLVDMAYEAGANKDKPAPQSGTVSPGDSRLKHWETSAQWLVERRAADETIEANIVFGWPGVDDAVHRRLKKAALSAALKSEADPSNGPNVMAGGTGEMDHKVHLDKAVKWLTERYTKDEILVAHITRYNLKDQADRIRLFNAAHAYACNVGANVPVNTQGDHSAEANVKGDETIEPDHVQYQKNFEKWLADNPPVKVTGKESDSTTLNQADVNSGETRRSSPGEIATNERPSNSETKRTAPGAINSYSASPRASNIKPSVSRLRRAATNFGMGVLLVLASPLLALGWIGYVIFFKRKRSETDDDEGDATAQSLQSQNVTPLVNDVATDTPAIVAAS